MSKIFFPPEWYSQSAIQLTWPHGESDWSYMIEEVTACFVNIASEIMKRQKLIIVCHNSEAVKYRLEKEKKYFHNLVLVELPSNDTWARDHGGITVYKDGKPVVLDFGFNGWGLKYPANFDNQLTRALYSEGLFGEQTGYEEHLTFILEGGSIESDGKGTLLTTAACLLSENRNNKSRE